MKKYLFILFLVFLAVYAFSNPVITNGELISWPDASGSIQIPDIVTSIHDSAFFNNKNISSVYFPTSVTKIGKEAFEGCISIVSVVVGHADSLATDGVYIAPRAFSGCVALKSITLNNNVLTLDANNSPFMNLVSLSEVIIGDGTSTLPQNCFLNCKELKMVRIGQSNTSKTSVSIPSTAFLGCANLATALINKNFIVVGGTSPFINISNITFGNGVTFIYNYAFSNCSKLATVELPGSIVQLFSGAFQNCSSLKSISLPNVKIIGQNAFFNCSSLESINIPNAVKIIEGSTFYNCSKLTTITLGNSVSEIRSSAFYGCSALKAITLPNSMKIIGEKSFMECAVLQNIQLGNALTNIGAYAFSGCSKLENVFFSLTLEQIGTYAFEKCLGLTSLNFPGSILIIGEAAFSGCSAVETISIGEINNPGRPVTFGNFAFSGCNGVTSLYLNKNILDDPYHSPFMELTSLRTVSVSNCVTQLNTFAFYGCSKLEAITIPNSVNNIGSAAFQGCTSLTEIKLPKFLKQLSNQLFYGCTNLSTVNIPSDVKLLGSYVFYNCEKLQKINLPSEVELIGPIAFYGCKALVEMNSANQLPASTGTSCFTGIPFATATLYVPFGSKSKYLADSQWSVFTTIVEKDILKDTTHLSDTTTVFPKSFVGIEKRIQITAGGLTTALNTQELSTVNKLTITGNINASDFLVMRDQMPRLNIIDLTNVVIDSYSGWNGTAGNGFYPANTIPLSAFENKSSLYSIKLPNSIISIANKAFKQCVNLQQELKLPYSLKEIGYEAFSSCQSLYGTIEIPAKLTFLGERAFERCKKITQIKMSAELSAIEYSTFAGCEYLMKVDMSASVTTLKGSVFYDCGRLFVINIPSLRDIGDNAFAKCSGIRSFTFPRTLVSLGDYAFAGCYSLKEIVIPSSITRLGSGIFFDCITLATVHLPATLCSISDGVFANCSRIKTIYLHAVKPPLFDYPGYNFNGMAYLQGTLYVPKGTLNDYYQAPEWNMFNNIVEMSETALQQGVKAEVRIFPNPVTENIIISGLNKASELSIYDLTGNLIMKHHIDNNQSVSLKSLASGIYIALLRDGDNVIEKRIIKK